MFLFCVFTGIIGFSILKLLIMIFILKNWLQLKPLIMIFILKNTKLASALLVLIIKNELQIFLSRLLLGCQESYSFMLLSNCLWVPTSNCGHLLCNMQLSQAHSSWSYNQTIPFGSDFGISRSWILTPSMSMCVQQSYLHFRPLVARWIDVY